MIKVDLHTHSTASPDGGLTAHDYRTMLDSGGLDYVAVTDHDTIAFAQQLQAELGERVIIGEEVRTVDGEIIGLYLTETVPGGLSLAEAITAIRQQGGLVYVPHPFETVRSGLSRPVLDAVAGQVDIIEVYNGRAAFQKRHKKTAAWAALHAAAGAASSDSHGHSGWGRTYSVLPAVPDRDSLVSLLRVAQYEVRLPGARAVLSPKLNRLRKRFGYVA